MPRPKRIPTKTNTHQIPTPPSSLSHSPVSDAELAYSKAQSSVNSLHAQEDHRRLRAQVHISKGETEDVEIRLADEEGTSESLRQDLLRYHQRLNLASEAAQKVNMDLEARSRECETIRTELETSQASSTDSSKLLTEKLALSREIANMKPELDHLRTQTSANSSLIADKLSLQTQLDEKHAELEESRRQLKRVERQEEKRARKEEAAEKNVDELKKELADARKAQLKAEKERDKITTENAKVAQAQNDEELAHLRAELARELKEREKLEKSQAKEAQGWEADKAVLDDKLSQFRNKLKTTKERLRETEAELMILRSRPTETTAATSKAAQSKKRKASESVDPDAAIGTPGDGAASKRQKRASSILGEKSNFSITPFLNRTSSVQPEGADEPIASIEDQSPSSRSSTRVLAPAGAGKSNLKAKPNKPARKRSAAAEPTLELVEEEEGSGDENSVPITMKVPLKDASPSSKPSKPTLKPRKSLVNFASFREGSLQPRSRLGSLEPVTTKKKRKLTGSAGGKTLMDDDEDEDTVGGAPGGFGSLGGKSLFGGGGQRAFGSFGKTAGGLGGSLLRNSKGPLQTADGFAFSPLKKERRAMAAAARATSEVPAA